MSSFRFRSAFGSAFDDWLFRNGIRIPKSLKDKMEANCVASVDVLSELKKMGDSSLAEIMADLKLKTVEKAVFNVIISKLDGNSGSNHNNDNGPGAQIMTVVPEIISIADNKNGTVNVEWKLTQKPLNNDSENRLKLEWAEDEKALDFDHTNDEIIDMNKIDLNVIHKTKNVLIHNINANIFRLKWRNFSNAKKMKIVSDLWDKNNKGQYMQIINDNIAKHNAGNKWNSIYGTVICKAPYAYHWRFRIKTFAAHFMFGISRVSNQYKWKESYIGCEKPAYYVNTTTAAHIYRAEGDVSGEYGAKRLNKNGCVLDMCLDLRNHTLDFKTGDQDIGLTISNLPEEQYRMVVSMYNGQQIELVAFDYH